MKVIRRGDHEWVSIKEIADILGCPTHRIYNNIKRIPHMKTGNTYLIDKLRLMKMLDYDLKNLDAILPAKNDWSKFSDYLSSSDQDRITLTIWEIIKISGANNSMLYFPSEWDANATKGMSGACKAMFEAGFDVVDMKFASSPQHKTYVISELTFERVKKVPDSSEQSSGITRAEQNRLLVPEYKKIFVNYNSAGARIHLDNCSYVKNISNEEELPANWEEFRTLELAEKKCDEEYGRNWRHCFRCFKTDFDLLMEGITFN